MPANVNPIFTLTPNVGQVLIPTTNAQVKSDGTSAGSSNDFMYKAFTAGANGSRINFIRWWAVASAAATSSVATVLRAYLSSISSPGTTTDADTWLLGELSVGIISASNSLSAVNYFDMPLNIDIPASRYIHVSQHIAQTTNQRWMAMVFGADY